MAPAKSIIFCVKHLEIDVEQPQGKAFIYSLAADLIVRTYFIVQKMPGDNCNGMRERPWVKGQRCYLVR